MQISCEWNANLQIADKNISNSHHWHKIRRLALDERRAEARSDGKNFEN